MTTALAERTQALGAGEIERVLITGDLSRLTAEQRLTYYNQVCASLGLNPLTKPFAYLKLNGKEILYALKDATEQLRRVHGVSITEITSTQLEDVFVVTAKAQDRSGRTDAATGAVAIGNLKGEALANALMKAETKAKRRATLSICGLGMLDETEVETIPNHAPLVVDAPKAIQRQPLPEGHVYILNVTPKMYGADLTAVDADGVDTTYPVPDRQCAELAEAVVQEGVPVKLTLVKGARDGKVKVKAIERYRVATEPNTDLGSVDGVPLTAADIPF